VLYESYKVTNAYSVLCIFQSAVSSFGYVSQFFLAKRIYEMLQDCIYSHLKCRWFFYCMHFATASFCPQPDKRQIKKLNTSWISLLCLLVPTLLYILE